MLKSGLSDFRVGRNFDIEFGCDLTRQEHVRELWKYVKQCKPRVIIMAPPCTAFGPWSHLNKIKARLAWLRSLRTGKHLARLCSELALHQLHHGYDFLAENPFPSGLWKVAKWPTILAHPKVHTAICSQCLTGLKDPESGLFYRKRTGFVAV